MNRLIGPLLLLSLLLSLPVLAEEIASKNSVLVAISKNNSLSLNYQSQLFTRFNLVNLTLPASGVTINLPIRRNSRGKAYLRAVSNSWDTKNISWKNRPAAKGPVIAKFNIKASQVRLRADITKFITASEEQSFVFYCRRGAKVLLRKSGSFTAPAVIKYPKVTTINPGNTPLPSPSPGTAGTPVPTVSGITVKRGPYLQRGTSDSVIVKWRSNIPTNSIVYYGTASDSLTFRAEDKSQTSDHRVQLTGLIPDIKYYYLIGSSAGAHQPADKEQFFITAPAGGNRKNTRVWVLGDSGTANAGARAVRDAYLNFTGSKHTDLWLMLGDNAYNSGTDSEYQSAVFDMYPSILKKSVLWPTIGNHDSGDLQSVSQSSPYFSIFSLPRNGEAGGIASGTESYYSFDYGDIHFICLNSMGSAHRALDGPMISWLRSDLTASSAQKWIVAFWHHPPYSKGSRDSDNEAALREMRERFLPVLEDGAVDLILAGHSHSYERSYLIDGHYGDSSTFNDSFKISAETSSFNKNYYTSHAGAIYVVAGSSGKISSAPLNHPAMYKSAATLGSLVLDFEGDSLNARFISSSGQIDDVFNIQKSP